MGSHVQSLQAEQQQGEGKDGFGFGLGLSDSIGTISEGMGWLLNTHAGAMGAFPHVLDGLTNGANLATAFGKSANMIGIKIFDGFLSGGEEGDGGDEVQQDGGFIDPSDYQHANESMGHDFNGFGANAHDEGLYHGQDIAPSPSPAVGGNRSHGFDFDD